METIVEAARCHETCHITGRCQPGCGPKDGECRKAFTVRYPDGAYDCHCTMCVIREEFDALEYDENA